MLTKTFSNFYTLNLLLDKPKMKYLYFTKIFLFGLLFYSYSILFLSPLKHFFIDQIPELSTYYAGQSVQTLDFFLIFQTIFLAPVLEELTFRNLLSNNTNIIILSSLLICLFNPLLTPFVLITIFILKSIVVEKISHKSIFVVSVLFAIAHVFNTPNVLINNPILFQTLISIPLFLVPYFVLGYHLGVIKVNLGIKWSIIGHIFYNLIFVIMSYIST